MNPIAYLSKYLRRTFIPLFVAAFFVLLSACSPSIHDAIARGNLEEVRKQVAANPSVINALDGKKKTPLHKAVTYKQLEAMEILVNAGADLNARDITGMTPLHVSAMLGRQEEAEWLLEHGADPMLADDYGDLPIHTAAVFGQGQIIGLLVRRGMDADITNASGQTPEGAARQYRQERVVRYIAHLRDQST